MGQVAWGFHSAEVGEENTLVAGIQDKGEDSMTLADREGPPTHAERPNMLTHGSHLPPTTPTAHFAQVLLMQRALCHTFPVI